MDDAHVLPVMGEITARRSIRAYTDRRVDPAVIDRLLTAASHAPSARNTRPWEFVITTDPAKLVAVGAMKPHSHQAAGASAVVVVAAHEYDYWVEDCSIAASYMQLEAVHQGIGSCWIQCRQSRTTDGNDAEEYIRTVFGIPSGIRVLCCICFGYPAGTAAPHGDADMMPHRIHRETW